MIIRNGIYQYNKPEENGELQKKFEAVDRLGAIRRREEYLAEQPQYTVPPMDMGEPEPKKDEKQEAIKKKIDTIPEPDSKVGKGELPQWLKPGGKGIDLSWKKVEDLGVVEDGEKVYLTKESFGLQPGNYEVYKERDYNTITNEDVDKWFAKDNAGNVTQFRTDEKDNESNWWDNPLNPFSWFN